MVDWDWTECRERRAKRCLTSAKLCEQASIEDIDCCHKSTLVGSVVKRLATRRWIVHHEPPIITGATGVGNTWIACALAKKACGEGDRVLHKRVPRLSNERQFGRADGSCAKLVGEIAKADVLVLDGLGLVPIGDVERRDLLEIIEDPHGLTWPTVISQLLQQPRSMIPFVDGGSVGGSRLTSSSRSRQVGRWMRAAAAEGEVSRDDPEAVAEAWARCPLAVKSAPRITDNDELQVKTWHDTIGDPAVVNAHIDLSKHDGPSVRMSRERRQMREAPWTAPELPRAVDRRWTAADA